MIAKSITGILRRTTEGRYALQRSSVRMPHAHASRSAGGENGGIVIAHPSRDRRDENAADEAIRAAWPFIRIGIAQRLSAGEMLSSLATFVINGTDEALAEVARELGWRPESGVYGILTQEEVRELAEAIDPSLRIKLDQPPSPGCIWTLTVVNGRGGLAAVEWTGPSAGLPPQHSETEDAQMRAKRYRRLAALLNELVAEEGPHLSDIEPVQLREPVL